MADAGGSPDRVLADGLPQIIDTAHFLAYGDDTLLKGGDPRGIISPVFQATQPLQEDGNCF